MSTSNSTQSQKQKEVRPNKLKPAYRIGIVGPKASGKTCMITALCMLRDPNPKGFTATIPPFGGEADERAQKGRTCIKKSVELLKKGEWPEANPLDAEWQRVLVEFTRPKKEGDDVGVGRIIELNDYSGELLDPNLASENVAQHIHDMLAEMDGWIVLAEYPRTEEDKSTLEESLHRFKQTLSKMEGDKQRLQSRPCAFVVNKWDRSPDYDPDASSDHQSGLITTSFFKEKPAPAHLDLANKLENTNRGPFKCFAVSAMGRIRVENGKDQTPTGERLQSRGLEDPFLWIINQRDEFRRRALIRRSTIGLASVAAILIGCLMVEWFFDQRGEAEAIDNIQSSASEGWREGVKWYRDYAESSTWQHTLYGLSLPRSAAFEKARSLESVKMDNSWEAIPAVSASDDATTLEVAESMLREHLKDFPNSDHIESANLRLAKIGQRRTDLMFMKKLVNWQSRFGQVDEKALDSQEELKSLNLLIEELIECDDVPLSGSLRDQWGQLVDDVQAKVSATKRKLAEIEEYDDIEDLIATDKFAEAGSKLLSSKHPHSELHEKWVSRVGKATESRADSICKKGQEWDEAVAFIGVILEPRMKELLSVELRERLEKAQAGYKREGDSYLYKIVVQNRDSQSIENYLKKAPLGTMSTEVSEYQRWLKERINSKKITVRLTSVAWSKNVKGEDTIVKLYVNGKGDARNPNVIKNPERVGTWYNSSKRQVSIQTPQNREIEIVVQFWENFHWKGRQEKRGRLKLNNMTPEKLASGHVSRDDRGNILRIAVDGVFEEPPLPKWRTTAR